MHKPRKLPTLWWLKTLVVVRLTTTTTAISTWGTKAVVATLVQCANPSPQRYKHLKFVQVDSYGLGLQKNTIILILALAKLITLWTSLSCLQPSCWMIQAPPSGFTSLCESVTEKGFLITWLRYASFSVLWYCSNQRGGRFRCLITATAVPKSDLGQQRYRHSRSAAVGSHSPASTEPLNSNTNPLFQEVTLFQEAQDIK